MEAQSMPWISPGAIWFYSWSAANLGGNDKIEYTHDTILLGKTCEILKTTRYVYGASGPGLPISLLYSQELPNNYTYNNGDTVFYLNINQFNILYNFGAQINDQWDLGVDTSAAQCSSSIVKVDSASSLTINSSSYRVLYTSDSANSSIGIAGKIIEHIGSMNYLFPTGRNCDTQTVVDFYVFSFSCFQDNAVNYMVVPPDECENPYHVGITELEIRRSQIQCFPNPVESELSINFLTKDNYCICIYNLLGEKEMERITQKNQLLNIDISDFPSGIYVATFQNSLGESVTKKIIKK